MTRLLFSRTALLGALFASVAGILTGQELSLEELVPALKKQAVKMAIVARLVEQNQEEVWNSINSKVTIPGRPIGMKLVGNNIVVAVQFTPYRQRNGRNILVAQGQIWIDVPNHGIRYLSTMETIPLDYGEQICFFPLGPGQNLNEPRIEILVELQPYIENQDVPASEAPTSRISDPSDSENKSRIRETPVLNE